MYLEGENMDSVPSPSVRIVVRDELPSFLRTTQYVTVTSPTNARLHTSTHSAYRFSLRGQSQCENSARS